MSRTDWWDTRAVVDRMFSDITAPADPLHQVPVTDETRPDAATVHLIRWALERNRQRRNYLDALRGEV